MFILLKSKQTVSLAHFQVMEFEEFWYFWNKYARNRVRLIGIPIGF